MASPRTTPTSPGELASLFPAASREAWRSLAERTLKGAPVETLARRTLEGLVIQPLYERPAQCAAVDPPAPGWEVRARVSAQDPAAANAAALGELAQGADSLLVCLGDRNRQGEAAATPEAFARLMEGVVLDAAPVALDAGFRGVWAAEQLAGAAKGAPTARLAFHLDPLGAFSEAGASPEAIATMVADAARAAVGQAERYPLATFFLASGQPLHEAGGGEAAELAAAVGSAIAYAKAMEEAGLARAEGLGRIVIGLASDADVFLTIAKLRAARLLWGRVAAACGAMAPARIEARSSARMLTRADPWTNMIRLTAAAFGAAAGGADAIVLGAFTDALGPPSAFARRQSRNAQLVLREEAGLGRVADPAAGSGCVEALTDSLARAAWTRLQEIEAAGGMVEALEAGLLAQMAAGGRAELAERISKGDLRILGVTDHPPVEERPVPLDPAMTSPAPAGPKEPVPAPASSCPALTTVRLEALA